MQKLKHLQSISLERVSYLCLDETSEISILWRCGPLIHHVEFGKALLSLLVKYERIVHPVLVNRRSKRPCLYYSNAYATFRPLIGHVLFKLNSGPDTNQVNHRSSNLTFCLLNARSLRNKSASFCDYVQDSLIALGVNEKLIYVVDITFGINESIFSGNERQKVYYKYYSWVAFQFPCLIWTFCWQTN